MVVSSNGDGLEVEIGADSSQLQSEVGDAIGSLGGLQGAALAASGALVTLGAVGLAKATTAAADFQERMTDIERVTSSETVGPLRSELMDLNSEIPISIDGLADIAEQAGRLGVEGPENISRFTESVAKISVATSLTADEAAENFAKIANALGTPISEIENMGSAVNTLSQTTASSTDEILSAMRKAAPAAAALGVEFDDLAGAAATLTSSGMNAERAGTRLNRAFSKLASNTGAAAQALGMTEQEFTALLEDDPAKALQLLTQEFGEIESKTQRMQTIEEIFGANAAKAINTLATNTEGFNENLDSSAESYSEASSLQREFELTMENVNQQASVLVDNLTNIGITTGKVVLPAVAALLSGLNTGVKVFGEMNEATGGWMGTILGLTAILGGAAIAVSAFGGAAGIASIGVGALATATTILASPLYLAVAAVVALTLAVGALAAAWKNDWYGIRGVTEDAVNWVIQKLNDLIGVYNSIADTIGREEIEPFDNVDFSKAEEAEQGGKETAEAGADGFKDKMAEMMGGQAATESMFPGPGQARSAGLAAGQEFQSGVQASMSDDTEIKSWTPAIRDTLREGAEGYKSEDLRPVATEIRPELVQAMAESKKGVSAERLGVTQDEFRVLLQRADLGSGMAGSAQVSSGTTQIAQADVQARSSSGMGLGKHVKRFGGAVDEFVAAIQNQEVVVTVDGGEFGRVIDARYESNSQQTATQAQNYGVYTQ